MDLLKFLLALLILFHHFQMTVSVDFGFIDFVSGVFNFAMIVEFFFLISGFLAACKMKKTAESSFESYILNKIQRLYPTAVLSVLILSALMIFDYLFNGQFRQGLVPDVFKIFNSILITFSGYSIKVGRGINNPLWYVGVLMICDILFYLVLKISRKTGIRELYLFIFICLLGIGIHDYGIDLPFANLDVSRGYSAFFYGVIMYYIYDNYSHSFLTMGSLVVSVICAGLFLFDNVSFFGYDWGAFVFIVFPCVMFLMLGMEKFLGHKLFKTLGGMSYQIYIWHSLFNYVMLMNEDLLKPMCAQPLLFLGIYTVIVCAFSYLMYRFVERKLRAWVLKAHAKIFTGHVQ